jgi:hypothetical protein
VRSTNVPTADSRRRHRQPWPLRTGLKWLHLSCSVLVAIDGQPAPRCSSRFELKVFEVCQRFGCRCVWKEVRAAERVSVARAERSQLSSDEMPTRSSALT